MKMRDEKTRVFVGLYFDQSKIKPTSSSEDLQLMAKEFVKQHKNLNNLDVEIVTSELEVYKKRKNHQMKNFTEEKKK